MEWVETTGRSVNEAKEAALDQLGIDAADAEFEVISEPKTGIFGRLKNEARVRARVAPTTPRAKETNNRRRNPRGEHQERSGSGARNRSTKTENSDTTANSDRVPAKRAKSRSSGPSKAKNNTTSDQGAKVTDEDEYVPLENQGAVAEEFLQGFFQSLNSPVTIDRRDDEEDQIVRLSVNGSNLGHLIGQRGATLHSLQEITRTVVQRKTGSRSGRVVLDISGYREKRKSALEKFAQQIADEVKASSEKKVLEPMNPADRKIVHDAINEIDGVSTTSEGEEPRRYVVIQPSA